MASWKAVSGGSAPPANWYPDPTDPTKVRYWDGTAWTAHTAPVPAQRAGTEQQTAAATPAVGKPERTAPVAHAGTASRGFPEPPGQSRSGLFGSKKALEEELQRLRDVVDGFGYAERQALQAEIDRLRGQREQLTADVAARNSELAALDAQIVKTREEHILQEVGVYDYHHRLEDSVAYRARLDLVRTQIKEMSKRDGGAVTATTNWTVDGSAAKGRKMANEFSKLLLRAYNGEADVLVNKLRPYKLDAAVEQLGKSRATISRLGGTMSIAITERFHALRIEEMRLTADFLAKKEEEKEAERAERERLRDEAKARREFEEAKARLLKERSHYSTALERLRQTGTPEQIAGAEQAVADIEEAIQGVEEREANIRAGYVYVISNIGSFGPSIVKIGMTRRLDPRERVHELGDASVPFRYDVHALVFADDAVSLESRLHAAFADRRVNLVNMRREFFYATPAEVQAVLTEAEGSLLEFVEEPEADEWHQSTNARRRSGVAVTSMSIEQSVTQAEPRH